MLVCHFMASAGAMLANAATMIQGDMLNSWEIATASLICQDIADTYSCLILQRWLDDKAAMR